MDWNGHEASAALAAHHPFIYPELCSSGFHIPTQHSFPDVTQSYQLAMKLLFTVKSAAIWEKVQNLKLYESKLDLKYTGWNMMHREDTDYSWTQRLHLLNVVSTHMHMFWNQTSLIHLIITFRLWGDDPRPLKLPISLVQLQFKTPFFPIQQKSTGSNKQASHICLIFKVDGGASLP